MRPRDSEQEDPTPELGPEPALAPRTGGGLSSMVVRPTETGGGSDFDPGETSALKDRRGSPPTDLRRRASPPPPHRRNSPPDFRRRGSPLSFHRRGSPPSFHRRDSPPPLHRRASPQAFHRHGSPLAFPRRFSPPAIRRRGSPPDFHHRSQRFNENPGYVMRGGSISPPPRRQRLDDGRYDPDFDHSDGPRIGRGFQSGRGGGRFRDVSPRHGPGRGGRSFGRGRNVPGRGSPPFEGEYVHRNDPNLSPREGDWICRNPSCGNLNFARRSYCNNCNKFRFGPELHESSHSPPRRGYFDSPPPHRSPPRISAPPLKDMNVMYKSPPRGWDTCSPRDFETGSPPPGRGRFPYRMRRDRPDYHEEYEYRGRGGKFDLPVHDDWDRRHRRRDGSTPDRRGYDDRRPPSPRDLSIRDSRGRSRSPIAGRPLNGPYGGRGQVDRRYDGPFVGRGPSDDLDAGRGRRFRQGDDSYTGQGRGLRRGMARGRNGGMY